MKADRRARAPRRRARPSGERDRPAGPPTARGLAVDLLSRLGREAGGLEDILARMRGVEALAARDRAFALALAVTVCRYGPRLDAAAAPFLSGKRLDVAVRLFLRVGIPQLLFLETPAHAAVGETVAAARGDREARAASGLLNAVLRRVGEDDDARARVMATDPLQALPEDVARRWSAHYGALKTHAIAAAMATRPRVFLTPKDGDAAALADRIGGRVLFDVVQAPAETAVEDLPGYAAGDWWVQDPASALVGRLAGATPGARVIDLAAAPGGKTMQLAAAGAAVTALEIADARLALLKANLARTGLDARLIHADAQTWRPDAPADIVLLDAPCSATGTLRRRPDILWARADGDVRALAHLQSALLAAAGAMVRPGGRLVYAVCSLEPEEGEAQAHGFLSDHPDFAPDPPGAGELGSFASTTTPEGFVRITPDFGGEHGGCDGFFIARFRKAG